MFQKLRVRITYANVMATVAVVLVVGGGALAVGAIPGPDGRIHSCLKTVKPGKGKVRVVSHTATCKTGERLLTWNQRGPRGERGLRGLRGFEGDEGDEGDQGVPGPTASTGATNDVPIDSEIPLETTNQVVLDLNAANSQGGSQQLTTTFASRIVANAHVILVNGSAAQNNAACHLQISDGTGPSNGITAISTATSTTFPVLNAFSTTVPLTGSAAKPAGTYNVRVACKEQFGSVEASSGTLSVVATAQ
jgi:hypothetical protein